MKIDHSVRNGTPMDNISEWNGRMTGLEWNTGPEWNDHRKRIFYGIGFDGFHTACWYG